MTKKTITILIDFSPYSEILLSIADQWSKVLNANIKIVHQVSGYVPGFTDSKGKAAILEAEMADALKRLKSLATQYLSVPSMAKFQTTEKDIVSFLRSASTADEDQLILLGLKGTGYLKQIFIGSTATRIIDDLNELVLTVPLEATIDFPSKIIVALSYLHPINEKALAGFLQSVSGKVNEIEFITVVKQEDDYNMALAYLLSQEHIFKPYCNAGHKIFVGNNAMETIKEYVLEEGNSVLVVQKGSRTLKDKLLRKFVIEELVYEGEIPLLVIPIE